MLYIDDMDRKQ